MAVTYDNLTNTDSTKTPRISFRWVAGTLALRETHHGSRVSHTNQIINFQPLTWITFKALLRKSNWRGSAIVRTRWDPKKFQIVSTKKVIFIRPEMSSHISSELFQQKRFTGSLNQSLAARQGNWKPSWNSESSSTLCLFKWYCHHVFCEFVSRSFPNTSDEQGVVDTIVTFDSRTKKKASLTQQTSQNMRTQKHAKTAGTTRTFRENQFETIRLVAVGMVTWCNEVVANMSFCHLYFKYRIYSFSFCSFGCCFRCPECFCCFPLLGLLDFLCSLPCPLASIFTSNIWTHLNRLRLRLCFMCILIFCDFRWRGSQIFLTRFAKMKPSSGLWLLKQYHLWEKLGHKTRHDHIGTFSFGILKGSKQFIFISHCDDWIFFAWAKTPQTKNADA